VAKQCVAANLFCRTTASVAAPNLLAGVVGEEEVLYSDELLRIDCYYKS
jgi:hypothetical protein